MRVLILATAVSVVVVAAAAAQEFDIFDANDFLDPRVRGAVFSNKQCGQVRDSRCGIDSEGTPFTIGRIYAGRVGDYVWRNKQTKVDLNFIHLTTSVYRRENQFNAKLTLLDGEKDTGLPRYRGTLQYGYYFLTDSPDPEADAKDTSARAAGRILVSASLEENGFARAGGDTAGHDYNYELGAQLDAYVRVKGRSAIGSLVWVRRYAYDEGIVHRVTYFYRNGDLVKGPFRLSTSLGLGGEKVGEWHWGALRAVLQVAIDIKPLRTTLNLVYAPSYVPRQSERRTHHEVAVFVDATVFRSFR